MLFKEKIFLANCDSVRRLDYYELWKRIRIGLVFADGIILSPNALIDNENIFNALNDNQLVKYLKEEGLGKLLVRGKDVYLGQTLMEYFNNLPGNYIFSSIDGTPAKRALSQDQLNNLVERINYVDNFLLDISAQRERVELTPHSLSMQLVDRIAGVDFLDLQVKNNLQESFKKVVSRSDAYKIIQSPNLIDFSERLRVELVDPSYNLLFVKPGETFAQDKIKILDRIPNKILDVAVTIKSLREEIELLSFIWDSVVFIRSAGAEDLLRVVTKKAIDYIEDRFLNNGFEMLSRKNWFGLYPKLARKMGIEFK